MTRNATKINTRQVNPRDIDALRNIKKGRIFLNKERIKEEIERIENIMKDKSSHFIQDELKQYLKILKRQLKQMKKE